MRVAIDTTYAGFGPSGTGVYIERLIAGLEAEGVEVVRLRTPLRKKRGGRNKLRSAANATLDAAWTRQLLPRVPPPRGVSAARCAATARRSRPGGARTRRRARSPPAGSQWATTRAVGGAGRRPLLAPLRSEAARASTPGRARRWPPSAACCGHRAGCAATAAAARPQPPRPRAPVSGSGCTPTSPNGRAARKSCRSRRASISAPPVRTTSHCATRARSRGSPCPRACCAGSGG